MMNSINSTSNFVNIPSHSVVREQPVQLPVILTPEQQNTIDNKLYDLNAEKELSELNQKKAAWELSVMEQYVESQKEVIDAYVRSANADTLYEYNEDEVSLTERYTQLRQFQENQTPANPSLPNSPGSDLDIDFEIQALSIATQSQLQVNEYQKTQSDRVNSLLHLSV